MLVQNMAVMVAQLDAKTDVLAAQMEDLTNTSAADYGCNMTTTSSCNVTLKSMQAMALTVGFTIGCSGQMYHVRYEGAVASSIPKC